MREDRAPHSGRTIKRILCNALLAYFLYMKQEELNQILIENRKMRKALERIAKWRGEFPPASLRDGTPCTYETAKGSNGARDYMREVAREALSG